MGDGILVEYTWTHFRLYDLVAVAEDEPRNLAQRCLVAERITEFRKRGFTLANDTNIETAKLFQCLLWQRRNMDTAHNRHCGWEPGLEQRRQIGSRLNLVGKRR